MESMQSGQSRGVKILSFEDMMKSSKAFQENPRNNKKGSNPLPKRHIVALETENLVNVAKETAVNSSSSSKVSHPISSSAKESSSTLVGVDDLDLPDELVQRMYDHQKDGVSWLYSLHMSKAHCGGILGDDMGLGKTFQTVMLLTGLLRQKDIASVLILCPVSVLQSWLREITAHLLPHVTKRLRLELASSDMSKKKREKVLSEVWERATVSTPRIVISSYQLVTNMIDDFSGAKYMNAGGATSQWDYVILDEGHIIKNPATQMSQAMHRLPCHSRLILSGTPIQNNLTEFFALLNWCTKGRLLGTKAEFKKQFMEPIVSGQDPGASQHIRELAATATKKLTAIVAPVVLQRKKENIAKVRGVLEEFQKLTQQQQQQQQQKKSDTTRNQHEVSNNTIVGAQKVILDLPEKTELAVWIPLSAPQRQLYEEYLSTRDVASALERVHYPVEHINHLKTLCRHPFLAEAAHATRVRKAHLGRQVVSDSGSGEVDDLDSMLRNLSLSAKGCSNSKHHASATSYDSEEETLFGDAICQKSAVEEESVLTAGAPLENEERYHNKLPPDASVFDVACRQPSVEELLAGSVKLEVLLELIIRLRKKKHRILIFSQSRMTVDILAFVLHAHNLLTVRIDGKVTGRERQRIIDDFNRPISDGDKDETIFHKQRAHIALLTTRACGTGITLTGADRVILHDPSWNPAEDRQAVDRAYRIGQQRDVTVYRLIMASTVEEKMYEKQVFKDGVRVVMEQGKQSSSRYFSAQETKELFMLGPAQESIVLNKLWECAGEKMTQVEDTSGDLSGVLGYSRHDRLYEAAKYEMNAIYATKLKTPIKSRSPHTKDLTASPSRAATPAEKSPMQFFNHYTKEDLLRKIERERQENLEEKRAHENTNKRDIPFEAAEDNTPVKHFFDFTVSTPATPNIGSFTASPEQSLERESIAACELLNDGDKESLLSENGSCLNATEDSASASEVHNIETETRHRGSGDIEEIEEEQDYSQDLTFICDDNAVDCVYDSDVDEGLVPKGILESSRSSTAEVNGPVSNRSASSEVDLRSPERTPMPSAPHTPLSDIKIGTTKNTSTHRRIIMESDESSSKLSADAIEPGRYSEDGFNNSIGGYDNFVPGVDGAQKANHGQREIAALQAEQEENELLINMTIEAENYVRSLQLSQTPTKSAEEEMEEKLAALSPLPYDPMFNTTHAIDSLPTGNIRLPVCIEFAAGVFKLPHHDSQKNRPLSLPLHKPASAMSSVSQMERYNHLLYCASKERSLTATADFEAEAALLCEALDLCDEDIGLHLRLADLLGKM